MPFLQKFIPEFFSPNEFLSTLDYDI